MERLWLDLSIAKSMMSVAVTTDVPVSVATRSMADHFIDAGVARTCVLVSVVGSVAGSVTYRGKRKIIIPVILSAFNKIFAYHIHHIRQDRNLLIKVYSS